MPTSGGRPCAEPIVPEPGYTPFHAHWEARAMAVTLAMGATGAWNIDMTRAARETLRDYGSLRYFQIWIVALETLLLERGLVQADELHAGRTHGGAPPEPPVPPVLPAPQVLPRVLRAAEVPGVLARGAPTARPAAAPARYAVGDRVRTRASVPAHHTRLPGYARGRVGVIERTHGAHVFADTHAQGQGEQPQWLHTVVFAASELWGPGAAPTQSVSIDAWEPYLEPA